MKGIGVDIIEIKRIDESIKKHGQAFLDKLFTPKEIAYCNTFKKDASTHFAGRFTAKEAIAKALKVGFGEFLKWKDIEILPGIHGEPTVTLSLEARERFQSKIEVTLSHSKDYAVAFAMSL